MTRHAWAAGLFAAAMATTACSPPTPVERLPSAAETLADVGRRLSARRSERDLNKIVADEACLLEQLSTRERDALARGARRFRVDRPSIVDVAALDARPPFWLKDQGFEPTPWTIGHPLGVFRVHRRVFEAGWVGLGPAGLDGRAAADYAVFVRGQDGTTPAIEGAETVPAGPGFGPHRDDLRPFGPLPQGLLGASLIRGSYAGRAGYRLGGGEAWKARIPSSVHPDQVNIAYGADASRSIVVSWRTSQQAGPSRIRLAREAGGSPVIEVEGGSTLVATPPVLNDPVNRRHRVAVEGLSPGTGYRYALTDGTGWTPWRPIKTGPPAGSDSSLMYLGDAQCFLEGWGELLAKAHARRPDIGLVLLAGDLVDRGGERTNWDHFFHRAAGVFDRVAFMPAAGNHEYLGDGPRLYRAAFPTPTNGPTGVDPGLVYAFRHGDATIVALDSTLAIDRPEMADLQAAWLDATLSASTATWSIVVFHHPLYASHPSRSYPELRDRWLPILDRHKVDLVLQGHDHAYLRTQPLRGGAPALGGTTYVVAVSGGKFSDRGDRPEAAVAFGEVSTYQTIDISAQERRLTYESFDGEGRSRDRLVLEKPKTEERQWDDSLRAGSDRERRPL